ncbi:MAG: TonB-dependent receptor [Pseudomonadota bacterium]
MMKRDDYATMPRSLRRTTAGAAMIGLSAAMLMPSTAAAQDAQTAEPEALATVQVEDTAIDPNPNAQLGVPFKARTSGDERHTRPLAETPATITVLTRAQIDQSGYTDLVRILDAQPGVTVGTGENGNAFGDRYIIRGQDVRSDVFVDGLRDPGMTTRESFAIEQLEITKGPNSSFAGRGASGGAINAITKAATTDYNFTRAAIGVGTDDFIRATADVNYATGNSFAVRANLLYAKTDVPEREPASRRRYGAAVSAVFTPTDALSLTLDYYGLRAHDRPDAGSFLITTAAGSREPVALGPSYTQVSDFQDSDVDTFTGRVKYAFSDGVKLSNITRYGQSYNRYFITGLANQVIPTATGSYQTGRLDGGHAGWQDLDYIANQTNLSVETGLLGMQHHFILGGEYTNHKVRSTTSAPGNALANPLSTTAAYYVTRTGAFNCATTLGGANNQYCITDATGNPVPNLSNLAGQSVTRAPFAARHWQVETVAGYLMDTVDLTSNVTLFGGVRLDHYRFDIGQYNVQTNAPVNFAGRTTNAFRYTDTLWNGHLGLTYKFGHGAMVYATASTAADINGGESDTTGAGYGGFLLDSAGGVVAKPERSRNYEIGTKWNILDEKLLLTASLFRTIKSDVMEGADYNSFGSFNTGKLRVQGAEFSVVGNITDQWSVQGGVALMRAKVLESANAGISAAQLALGATNLGKTISNFANTSVEFLTRYQFTDQFAMGAAVKYKSRRYGGQPDTAAAYSYSAAGQFAYTQPVPAYAVGDFFAEYKVNETIDFRLNVNNITNKEYYLAAYRAGFFLYKGDGRQVVGTLSIGF